MMFDPKQLVSFLPGFWKLKRHITHEFPTIESYDASGYAKFFLLEDNVLLYREEIQMQHLKTGAIFEGSQEYLYSYDPNLKELCKYFKDGRLFYKLGFCGKEASGVHRCKEDVYEARYMFDSHEKFFLTYRVKGPKKDYRHETFYIK
ncbi:MAG: hypothetical protein JSS34_04820 [Proteobacteria bacterium]|nr:hypothetical protein [Pseudomonadota bacterium]